jgi:hypothetical protein
MNDLGVPTGNPGWQTIGDVAYRTSPYEGRNVVELNYIENLGDEKGAGAAVLKKLTKVADEHQVPMTLNALPLPRGNGKGRIPIDKLVEFYKKHGFSVVDEGDGWANMRREPVLPVKADPEVLTGLKAAAGDAKVVAERIEGLTTDRAHMAAGNVVEGKPLVSPKAGFFTRLDEHLGRIGDAADARIKARLSQPSLGAAGGSELLSAKDLAISAAAKMFQMGIRGTKALTEALIKVHGDVIKPMVAKAIEDGRKLLSRLIANDTPTAKQLAAIKETYQSGAGGKDWYNETWGWLQQHFGDDAEMVGRFISATSLGNSTEGGATQTLKAYAQWKLGLPFDGHLNKVHASSLLKATRGEVFGDGKAQGFLGAITGDPNAVALDRHVMRTLGFKNAGKATGKSALSNSTYRLYSSIIRDLAAGEGVTPREYQSGLWVGKKIGDEQMAEQTGVTTRGGSFRPMEYLIGKRLGGLTPAEWVEQNKINVTSLRNATDGVQQARSAGGYSFNNSDFSEFKKPGFIVTMDHKVLPTGEASGTKVLEFAKRYKDLTGKYPGTLTGLYSRSDDPGNMHMDFNIHLPDHPGNEEFAKRLGLEGRQYAVGYVDKAGQYHDISTGYDPAIHGPQFPQRKVADIEAQLDAMKFPTFDTPGTDAKFLPPTMSQHAKLQFDPEIHQYAIDNPAMALSKYAEVAGKTPEEIKQMINDGNFKPMTDAGVAGAVVVNKDGIVWQYQDPVAPSYNTMTAIGSLRKNPMAMLDKLKGLDILRGHDVIEQYRNEAGAVSLGKRGEPAPDAEVNKVFAKMTQTGGRVVPETALSESRGVGSFWLLPNGRIVRSPMTHSGQARAMKIPGVRDYAGAEGRGSAGVQRLLNMGIIRVQSSYGAVAFDVAAAPTDIQRSILKRAATTQKFWAGQALDERGRPLHYAHSDSGTPIHHFLASLNK